MCKEIKNPKDCMDYRKVESFGRNAGCDIRQGKGDHRIMSYDENQVVYCARDMGLGLATKIFKFFLKSGLILFILFCGYMAYIANFS